MPKDGSRLEMTPRRCADRLAADQGFAEAQYILGAMYVAGRGVPQDDAGAVRWYRSAADQGVAEAQGALGAMYAFGQGVPRDDAEAVRNMHSPGRRPGLRSRAAQPRRVSCMPKDGAYLRTTCWPTCGLVSPPLKGERSGRAQSRRATKLLRGCRQLNVPAGKSWARIWRPGIAAQRRVIEVQQNLTDLGYDPGPVRRGRGAEDARRDSGTSRLISACQSTARFPISFTPH